MAFQPGRRTSEGEITVYVNEDSHAEVVNIQRSGYVWHTHASMNAQCLPNAGLGAVVNSEWKYFP